MKKLIPALAMLLIAAVLMGTSTYAWFSMNTSVQATGMEVKVKVQDNIQIAATGVASTAKEADNAFKYGYVMTHTEKTIEPVSSIDGVSFFYNSTKNATANGDAASETYVAYNHNDTSAFNTNYGTTDAVGYVEYAVQLKADNTTAADKFVNLTALNLTYGGSEANQKAFRAAIFVDDMGTTGATPASADQTTSNLKSILKMTGSTYYTTGKAVSSTTELNTVNPKLDTAANIGTVAANSTNYYKVVVRLWLEGEDTTCTNTTFATLNDDWAFDLTFSLQDATGGVSVISQPLTASKIDLTSASASATTKVVDGVTYYEITSHSGYYVTATGPITSASVIYSIDSNSIVLDVTNQCTLPAAP